MANARENDFDDTANHQKDSVMKRIFDRYENETISEEDVQRVLAPVLQMIQEVKFTKRRRMRRIRKIIVGSAVGVIAITIFAINVTSSDAILEIPEASIPLAGAPVAARSLSGKVTFESKGVNGVILTLVDADSGKASITATNSSGDYSFEVASDGEYQLEVEPPDGKKLEGGVDGFLLSVTDQEILEDVEIRLYTAQY